ncbi:hypothetical protein C1I99_02310 [Micromonospora deserti]|uniref:CBM6 domain-containing protein n=2 Tax=Micromonospora deserti TaxID=2070366 RepID=A0A2W2CS83_9ACTN|nr:hypothetical protein C1I99_02310 [Micromonospora deserti]
MVVGVGYLTIVLTLAAVKLDLDAGQSAAGGSPGTGGVTDQGSSGVEERDASSAPVITPTPAVGPGEMRVGSVENRSATPPAPRPPAAQRPTTPGTPPLVTSYEAESATNGLAGTTIYACSGCSGVKKVGRIGRGMGTLQFNGVVARTGGSATVTIAYVNGGSPRVGQISVNGGAPITLTFPGTGGWSSIGAIVVTVNLRPGPNTLKMFNPYAAAPDFDKITVSVR